jgi:hypothetical protein
VQRFLLAQQEVNATPRPPHTGPAS